MIMKKVLSIISLVAIAAIVLAACNSKPVEQFKNANTIRYEDTVGFAQFQAWKAMNERVDPTAGYGQAPVQRQPVRTVYRTRTVNQSGTMTSRSQNQAKVKKGWSKSAKYAVIGGTAGGVLGAVINKNNRVKGAIIGAVLGGGGGYVLGRSKDKKDGRF
jgi:hypothetical protein